MRAMKTEFAALATMRPTCSSSTMTVAFVTCCRAFFLSEGYRVTTAESAAEARAKLAGLRFDLMILDVMMPGETGFEFARSLRSTSQRADPDADRARRDG